MDFRLKVPIQLLLLNRVMKTCSVSSPVRRAVTKNGLWSRILLFNLMSINVSSKSQTASVAQRLIKFMNICIKATNFPGINIFLSMLLKLWLKCIFFFILRIALICAMLNIVLFIFSFRRKLSKTQCWQKKQKWNKLGMT